MPEWVITGPKQVFNFPEIRTMTCTISQDKAQGAPLRFFSFISDDKNMFIIRHYITEDDLDPFQAWLKKLRDPIAKGQVVKRVGRIKAGNFGDHKLCRDGGSGGGSAAVRR